MLRKVGSLLMIGFGAMACSDGGGPASLPEGHTTVLEDANAKVTDTAMVADENGEPLIAFLDGQSLEFTRWDRTTKAFTAPLTVAPTGGDVTSLAKRAVGLARDAVTGRLAIDFVRVQKNQNANDSTVVALTLSTDGGKTWSTPTTVTQSADTDVRDANDAAIAANGGTIWIAYQQDNYQCDIPNRGSCSGMWLLEGDGTTFTREIAKGSDGIPALADLSAPSLRLDATGKPAVAFVVDPLSGYDKTVVYWRSGSPVTPVFDSQGIQNDDATASLAFDGTKPRIAAHLTGASGDAGYDMLFSESSDGVTWTAPVQLPRDGGEVTTMYQDISVDAQGNLAVVADTNGGPGTNTCGGLAVLRSSDGAQWSACGADATKQFTGNFDAFVESYFTPDGQLAIVSAGNLMDNGPSGLHFWLVK